MTYRGFLIVKHPKEGYIIKAKDGEVLSSQPSIEFAQRFIDAHIRRGGK